MPAQSSGERQRVEKRSGELEVEVLRLQVGVPQRHESRVRGAERGEAAGDTAAPIGQPHGVETHLEHARAVGPHPNVTGDHTGTWDPPEPPIDEPKVSEGGGLGAHAKVEQYGVARPADQAARVAQRGPRQPDPCELQIQGVADHPKATGHVHKTRDRVGAFHGQSGYVDADPALPRGRYLERADAGVEVLEAADPHPSVRSPGLDLEARVARLGTRGLQAQRDAAVRDAHIAEQDERGRTAGPLVVLRGRRADAQQLLDVEPAVAVLYEIDHRPVQLELEQHDPAGGKVEGVVADVGLRQEGDQGGVRVEQPHVVEGDPSEERATRVPNLHRPGEYVLQRAFAHPRQQGAPRTGADQ